MACRSLAVFPSRYTKSTWFMLCFASLIGKSSSWFVENFQINLSNVRRAHSRGDEENFFFLLAVRIFLEGNVNYLGGSMTL